MPKGIEERKIDQKTSPGLKSYGGVIEVSDFDNSVTWDELIQDYTNMRNGDPVLSTATDILKLPILQSDYNIETKSKKTKGKEAAEYIKYCFDNIERGFQYVKYHSLLCLDYGVQMFERVWHRGAEYKGKPTNMLVKLSPIQSGTINEFHYDGFGNFTGIRHEARNPSGGVKYVDIDRKDLFVCTYNEEYNDVRGRSIYRPVRQSWNYKTKVLRGTTQAAARGGGIPHGTLYQGFGDAEELRLQKTLRTLGNSYESYMIDIDGKATVTLDELKNQENNMPLLEYFDRQIFFNTLTQFMTAGIGQNGSRAATSEHKSSYELAANYILMFLTDQFDRLIEDMIDQSPYYDLELEDYPFMSFDAITQVDLGKVASNLKTVSDMGGLKLTVEDEKYLREMFNMPEYDESAEPIKKIPEQLDPEKQEGEDPEPEEPKEKKEVKDKNLEIQFTKQLTMLEKQAHEKNVFEFESANEHYMTIKEKADKALNKVFKKVLADIAVQLKRNKKAELELRYERELIKEMTNLFDESYARGERDFKREVNKLRGNSKVLEAPPGKKKSINNSITRWVKRLFFNVKTTIEDQIDKLPDSFIEKKGGIEKYVLGFETGFKTEKRQILTETEGGYMAGRGAEIKNSLNVVSTYLYSAILDSNLCDTCAPFDGLIMTYEEALANSLDPFTKPLNLNCDGYGKCRCLLIPFELKGGI